MRALIWIGLMLVWLAALLFGVWWFWPLFKRMALTADLFAAALYLTIGAVTWLVALKLGIERYWRR